MTLKRLDAVPAYPKQMLIESILSKQLKQHDALLGDIKGKRRVSLET